MKTELANLRHQRSAKDFPEIDLMQDEFVVLAIKRSKLGMFLIWAGELVGFVALTAILILLSAGDSASSILGLNEASKSFLYLIIFILYGVLAISGVVGTVIYKSNSLFITNKRAIQRARGSLFASSVNVIDLQSIEDVSFQKNGLFDYIFQLGTIRMSTVGDETTYTFPYVDTPRDEIRTITKLVHQNKEENK